MNCTVFSTLLLATIAFILQTSALPMQKVHIEHESETITYQEGEPIALECEATSFYPPSFHWLLNGSYIEQGPLDHLAINVMSPNIRLSRVKEKASFYIPHARPENAGTYTCVADSPSHRTTKRYTVQVHRSTEQAAIEPEGSEVRIYDWSDVIFQTEGKPLYVKCRATQGTTRGAPAIKWTLNDIELTENDNIKIKPNGDLEVKKVTPDFHRYGDGAFGRNSLDCHAIGDDGLSTASHNVAVYVMPVDGFSAGNDSAEA